MATPDFICPDCGGRYFGTDARFPGIVECHAEGSDKPWRKCWRGLWPRNDSDPQLRKAERLLALWQQETIATDFSPQLRNATASYFADVAKRKAQPPAACVVADGEREGLVGECAALTALTAQHAAAVKRAEAYKARWHSLTGWILDRLAAGEIYCKGNYEAWKAGLAVVYDHIKELDPSVIQDMDAAQQGQPDVPPKPPMLLGRVMLKQTRLEWFAVAETAGLQGRWVRANGASQFDSLDFSEVDRKNSDAEALRLYDQDLKQEPQA